MPNQLPWEKYANSGTADAAPTEEGPWSKYAAADNTSAAATTATNANIDQPASDDDGAAWALARSAARGVVPGIAGTVSAIPGAAVGSVAGPVGTAVGGVAAGMAGSVAADKAQTALADEYAPDSWFGSKSAEKDERQHPWASTLGRLLAFGKPSLKAPLSAADALLTTEGRQGLAAASKSLNPFSQAGKDFAQKAAIAGSKEAAAQEALGHVLGASAGVGVGAAQGIAQGQDPLHAAGTAALGLGFEPWVHPGMVLGHADHKANSLNDLVNKVNDQKQNQNVNDSGQNQTTSVGADQSDDNNDQNITVDPEAAANIEKGGPTPAPVTAPDVTPIFKENQKPMIQLPVLSDADKVAVSAIEQKVGPLTAQVVAKVIAEKPAPAVPVTDPVPTQSAPEVTAPDTETVSGGKRLAPRTAEQYDVNRPYAPLKSNELSDLFDQAKQAGDVDTMQKLYQELGVRKSGPAQVLRQAVYHEILNRTGVGPVPVPLKYTTENAPAPQYRKPYTKPVVKQPELSSEPSSVVEPDDSEIPAHAVEPEKVEGDGRNISAVGEEKFSDKVFKNHGVSDSDLAKLVGSHNRAILSAERALEIVKKYGGPDEIEEAERQLRDAKQAKADALGSDSDLLLRSELAKKLNEGTHSWDSEKGLVKKESEQPPKSESLAPEPDQPSASDVGEAPAAEPTVSEEKQTEPVKFPGSAKQVENPNDVAAHNKLKSQFDQQIQDNPAILDDHIATKGRKQLISRWLATNILENSVLDSPADRRFVASFYQLKPGTVNRLTKWAATHDLENDPHRLVMAGHEDEALGLFDHTAEPIEKPADRDIASVSEIGSRGIDKVKEVESKIPAENLPAYEKALIAAHQVISRDLGEEVLNGKKIGTATDDPELESSEAPDNASEEERKLQGLPYRKTRVSSRFSGFSPTQLEAIRQRAETLARLTFARRLTPDSEGIVRGLPENIEPFVRSGGGGFLTKARGEVWSAVQKMKAEGVHELSLDKENSVSGRSLGDLVKNTQGHDEASNREDAGEELEHEDVDPDVEQKGAYNPANRQAEDIPEGTHSVEEGPAQPAEERTISPELKQRALEFLNSSGQKTNAMDKLAVLYRLAKEGAGSFSKGEEERLNVLGTALQRRESLSERPEEAKDQARMLADTEYGGHTLEELLNGEHRDETGAIREDLRVPDSEAHDYLPAAKDLTPAEKERLEPPRQIGSTATGEDLLKLMSESELKDPTLSALSKALMSNPATRKVLVRLFTHLESGVAASYHRASHTIDLAAITSPDGTRTVDPEHAVHEMMHALCRWFIDPANASQLTEKQKVAVQGIRDVYKAAMAHAFKTGVTSKADIERVKGLVRNRTALEQSDLTHYPWTSDQEFVAHALTNPEMRDFLASVPYRDKVTGKLTTALAKLLQWIKSAVLGLSPTDKSALGAAADHILTLATDETDAREGYKLNSESGASSETKNKVDKDPLDGVLYPSKNNYGAQEPEPQLPFVYAKGESQRGSDLRGPEGLRLLSGLLEDTASGNNRGDEGTGATDEALARGFEKLSKIVRERGLNIAPPFFKRLCNAQTDLNVPGAEHSVFGNSENLKVIKVTHPEPSGSLGAKGSPKDYFSSLFLNNLLFKTGTRFEGLVNLGHSLPQVVTSQPWFKGVKAPVKEIAADLEARGFVLEKAKKGVGVWKHEGLKVGLYDSDPANVIKSPDGALHYFDVDVFPLKGVTVEEVVRNIEAADRESKDLMPAVNTSTAGKNEPNYKDRDYNSYTEDETQKTASDFINSVGADAAYASLRKMLEDPKSSTYPRHVVTEGLRQLESFYDKEAATLKAKTSPDATDLLNRIKYANRVKELGDLIHPADTEAAQVLRGAQNKRLDAQDFVDQYQAGTGGLLNDRVAGKLDINSLINGIKDIKRQAADLTVDSSQKLLARFGIEGDEKLATLKTILADTDTTRADLKAALASLMGGRNPESVEAATQQLYALYNKASQKIARAQLPKEIYAAYASNGAPKDGTYADKLSKYIGIGKFDEDQIHKTLLESLGITGYDADFVKRIRYAADIIKTLPDGSDPKNVMVTDLQGAIGNEILNRRLAGGLKSAEWWKTVFGTILPDLFRSAILTGPQTFLTHGFSGSQNVRLQGLFQAYGEFQAALNRGVPFKESVGFFKDYMDTMLLGDNKGARGNPLVKEALRAWDTGRIGLGVSEGVGMRGADQLARGVGGAGAEGKAFRLYAKAIGRLPRFMMVFDALNAGSAREQLLRMSTRAALLNGGAKGEELATAMRKQFSPTQDELKAAHDELTKEIEAGYFRGLDQKDLAYSLANRLEQLHQANLPPEVLGKLKDTSRLTKDWTLKGDAKGLAGLVADGVIGTLNRKTRITQFIFPFVRIISNLMNNSLDYSPFGLLRANNASISNLLLVSDSKYAYQPMVKGSPEQIALTAKSMLGTVAATFITAWFLKQLHDEEETGKKPDFMFYGAGPKDPIKRGEWMSTGARPNTLKIGDNYIPYKAIPGVDLLGTMLGTLHDAVTFENPLPKAKHGVPPTPEEIAAHNNWLSSDKIYRIATGIAMSPLEHHFLSGAKNLIDIMYDPQGDKAVRAVQSQIAGTGSQFTNPSILRTVRGLLGGINQPDGNVPKLDLYNSAEGRAAQFIPFYFGYNKPALNVLGDPIQNKPTDALTDRWIFQAHQAPDPIISPLVNNGLFIPGAKQSTSLVVDDKGTYATLKQAGDDAWREFVIARGQFLKSVLTPEMVEQLTNMDRVEAQAILDGPGISAAASAYARAIVQQKILDKQIKINPLS